MQKIHNLNFPCGDYYPWDGVFTCEVVSPTELLFSTTCDGETYSVTLSITESKEIREIYYQDYRIHVECDGGCDTDLLIFFDPKSKTWVTPETCKNNSEGLEETVETDRKDVHLITRYWGSCIDVCKLSMEVIDDEDDDDECEYDVVEDMRFFADELRVITRASLIDGVLTIEQVDLVDFCLNQDYHSRATSETETIVDWLGDPWVDPRDPHGFGWEQVIEADREDLYLMIHSEGAYADVRRRDWGNRQYITDDSEFIDHLRFSADESRVITNITLVEELLTIYQVDRVVLNQDGDFTRKVKSKTYQIADWLAGSLNNKFVKHFAEDLMGQTPDPTMKVQSNQNQAYDIIGDIHGHAAELEDLLRTLGYGEVDGRYSHPEGRKVVFLGDYIDRGPNIRRVLQIVRGMIDSGEAYGILGNHEVNALWYHNKDDEGNFLRKHGPSETKQHAATLQQIAEPDPKEWSEWLDWLARLPLWIDFGAFRVVHACWSPVSIEALAGIDLSSHADLVKYSRKGSISNELLRPLLNGPELDLPAGRVFMASGNKECKEIRYKWWSSLSGLSYRQALYPGEDPQLPDDDIINPPAPYSVKSGDSILFFGHYAIQDTVPQRILPNLVCLDYGMGKGGQIVAYPWDGEVELNPSKFISVPQAGA